MKKIYLLLTTVMVFCLSVGVAFSGGSREGFSRLKVVTSTSLIAQIVERVGGEMVDVANIIPPAQCPGHFDVKPGDIQRLTEADIFILHGWQGEKFSKKLIASVNNPDLTVVIVHVRGNWMTPLVQQEAVDKITGALVQADAGNSSYYLKSAGEHKETIAAKGAEIRIKLDQANLSAVNVICAEMQAGFVKWAGLDVIATYARPDSLTPQVVKELVDKGKAENIDLIIDNMQSGKDAGAGIAEELGCTRIILSNFPGCFDNTATWEKAVDFNVELIIQAIAR